MTFEDIKQLIERGESRTLELKKSTGELKDAMHSACAMLNGSGGWLIFGVTPKSLKIIGQKVTDNTQQEIANALTGFEPSIEIDVDYIDVPDAKNGEQLIAMHFNGWAWGKHPYVYHGCPYYKPENTTKQMPLDMYDERVRESNPTKFAWEETLADDFTIDNLSVKRIKEVVRLGVESGRMHSSAIGAPINEVLQKLDVIKNERVKNAAVTLFAESTNGYPQLLLRMARFRGTDKNEFIDNQRVKGNIFDLLDAGMSFFFKHLSLSGVIKGLKREEHLEIPVSALREALINALCHRQYHIPGDSISIGIYDDRIEIINPGRFPNNLTPDTIKLPHESHPYNPIIANVLYLSTYLESWGSGAKRIIDACKEQNVQEPTWEISDSIVKVVFARKYSESIIYEDITTNNPTTTLQQPYNNPTTTLQQYDANIHINQQQMIVLNSLFDVEKSFSELKDICGYKDSISFRKILYEMIENGWVAMTHPENPNHRNQKYYLKELGKKVIGKK